MTARLRLFSEFVPYRRLTHELLALLAGRSIELALAVTPDELPGLEGALAACRDGGVPVALWPMIGDADGRWASIVNVAPFAVHVARVLEAAARRAGAATELILDLEPPVREVRRLLRGNPAALLSAVRGGGGAGGAASAYRAMAADARSAGLAVSAAVVPFVVWDPPGRVGRFQRWLGTPVDAIGADRYHVMAYSSLFEGYSRGVLGRRDALDLLGRVARAARFRWGEAASIVLGVIGRGALGDERRLRHAAELAEDAAVVRAAGIRELALHDLAGALARPPVEPWLDALAAAPRPSPRGSPRAALIERLARSLSG